MKFKWHVLLLAAALQVLCANGFAQTQYEFTGSYSSNWDEPFYGIQLNWDPQALPDDADADVWIPNYSGYFAVVGNGYFTVGRLEIDSGSSLEIAGGLNVQAGSFGGSGTVTDNGQITVDSGAALTNGGDISISGSGSITSAGNLQSAAGSKITINVPTTVTAGSFAGDGVISTMDLTINGSVAKTGSGPLVTGGAFTLTAGTTFDIGQGPVLIAGAGYNPTAVTTLIASAYDNGKWDGPGITSSLAAANPHLTAVAMGDNALLGLSSFDDQRVNGSTLILTYTWIGDANLDGIVNSADFALMKPTGTKNATWSMGDFNYDGVVNGDDYSLFMLGEAESGGANISATLPEPFSPMLVGLIILAHFFSRRRASETH